MHLSTSVMMQTTQLMAFMSDIKLLLMNTETVRIPPNHFMKKY